MIANTIHYIDEGVDSGDIIEIVKPEIVSCDNPETLYCKAKKKAIDRLIELIHEGKESIMQKSIPQNIMIGKQYKTEDRTILTDITYLYRKLTKQIGF